MFGHYSVGANTNKDENKRKDAKIAVRTTYFALRSISKASLDIELSSFIKNQPKLSCLTRGKNI